MRMGLSRGLMVETGYWMLLFCVVLPLRAPIMRLFVGADESAVALGASYLFLMAFFLFAACVHQRPAGVFFAGWEI